MLTARAKGSVASEIAWCPAWYPLFREGSLQGIPPWERMDLPLYWLNYAQAAENAENGARRELANRP